MNISRPLMVLRPEGSIDSLVAALRRLNVSRRLNGRVIVEARAVGSPALERKLQSWQCHDEHLASAHQTAQRITERLMDFSMRIKIEVRSRMTADDVAQVANDHEADLVIISRALPEARFGVAVPPFEARVCRLSPSPVWCASNRPMNSGVAVAVDPDTSSDEMRSLNIKLVREASAIAATATGSPELHLIGAWSLFGIAPGWWRRRDPATTELIRRTSQDAQLELDRLAASVCPSDVRVRAHLVEGAPSVAVPTFVAKTGVSLLVVGNHQRRGASHALHANTVESVLKRTSSSVLSVLPDTTEDWSVRTTESRPSTDRIDQSSKNAVA